MFLDENEKSPVLFLILTCCEFAFALLLQRQHCGNCSLMVSLWLCLVSSFFALYSSLIGVSSKTTKFQPMISSGATHVQTVQGPFSSQASFAGKWAFIADTCRWGPGRWPDVWGGNQWLYHSPVAVCRCCPGCNRPGPPLLCPSKAWPAAEFSWGQKQRRRRKKVKECLGWVQENDGYLLSFQELLGKIAAERDWKLCGLWLL